MKINDIKKALRLIAVTSLLLVITATCLGCNRQDKDFSLNNKKVYYQYYFNTDTQKFERIPNSYTFNKDGTFVFGYGDKDDTLSGTWTQAGGNYIEMKYDIENNDAIIQSIMRNLGANSDLKESDIINLVSQIDFNDTLFSYKDCVFSTTNIQAYKYISSDNKMGEATDEVEGVYVVMDFEYMLYVSNGYIYSQDEVDPKDDEYPIYRGYYRVIDDFIFIYLQDKKGGEVLANAVYYLGMVKLPDDLNIDEETDDATMKYLAKWSGMNVRCWTNTVYSTREVG